MNLIREKHEHGYFRAYSACFSLLRLDDTAAANANLHISADDTRLDKQAEILFSVRWPRLRLVVLSNW